MNQAEYDCEVLTPLFLGGADPRNEPPELRVPSLLGALRYWYRALVGGSSLYIDVDAVKSEEQNVFGSSDTGSAIAIRVSYEGDLSSDTYKKDKNRRGGKDYLFWSLAETSRQPARRFIQPGVKFHVTMRSIIQSDALLKAHSALWLLANLGALGARANRCAGSIAIQPSDYPADWPAFKSSRDVEALVADLSQGIVACRRALGDSTLQRSLPPGLFSDFDVLCHDAAEVWVVSPDNDNNGWAGYKEALNGMGEKLRVFRSHTNALGKADHDAVLEWMHRGGKGPNIQRAAFGLPLPFHYSNGGPGDTLQAEESDRRSSPLHMRVTRLANGRYVGVLVLFKSQFLDPGAQLQLHTRKWLAPPPPDYSVITRFINSFASKRRVAL